MHEKLKTVMAGNSFSLSTPKINNNKQKGIPNYCENK